MHPAIRIIALLAMEQAGMSGHIHKSFSKRALSTGRSGVNQGEKLVSSDNLQLSCFGLDGRIQLIYQFQPVDFESPQKHGRLSNSITALGIGS
jgi:hypothetical protein